MVTTQLACFFVQLPQYHFGAPAYLVAPFNNLWYALTRPCDFKGLAPAEDELALEGKSSSDS